jgi:hypothetical protein
MITHPTPSSTLQEQSSAVKPSSRRVALWIVLFSFAACSAWEVFRPNAHPFGDLSNGKMTDHLSHMNCARLFPRVGMDLWRKPVSRMFNELTPDERNKLPDDVKVGGSYSGGIYNVPGWPANKPLVVNWSHRRRCYPPGDIVLFSPIAVLYHWTALSATWANRLAILLCLLFAHGAIYLFIRLFLDKATADPSMALITVLIFYAFSVYWALQGFYDSAAVIPILLCGRYLVLNRGVDALLAFCVAAAIHFRTFFLAPLSLYATWTILRDRQWRTWQPRDWGKIVTAASLAMVSLYVFTLVWPTISTADFHNPANLWQPAPRYGFLCLTAVLWMYLAFAFASIGAWMDCFIMVWLSLMFGSAREAFEWHILIPMSWMGLPIMITGNENPKTVMVVRDLRLAVLLFIAFAVCGNQFTSI